MSITFDSIDATLRQITQRKEDDLRTTLDTIAGKDNPDTTDLYEMQRSMQQWTLMVQAQSTMVKELGDTLKGIVQKAG
ncbi:EscF/YscF/HrpA family type III secretion system needle major subunit [Pseudothauera rhizosphaerae]|uniref:Uncharacterized protein n=1 Tax=Pseudothauera rhizosphaerae TaxID=2565932 RepID=A0A4S4ADS6_9RHOO|nr:EscF/YscF/HrpA family type III secretion system needle major subunit [Pseudothauera rhizosphaerae]THF57254.1 hypothetical protein E6O51_18325 [Pseudothauera rhizosphaerae]